LTPCAVFTTNSIIDELELMQIKLHVLQQTGADAAAPEQAKMP
jgi:hypothetical protein